MIDDKELLELAAKACGLCQDGVFYGNKDWNPLLNDDEAFRLAARLLMSVYFGVSCVRCEFCVDGKSKAIVVSNKGYVLSAARRAIVKAAAEIGRAM